MKKFLSVILSAAMLFSLCGCNFSKGAKRSHAERDYVDHVKPGYGGQSVRSDGVKVGVSLPTKDLFRWDNDGSQMKVELEAAGFSVDLQYAANRVDTQIAQLEDMINSGCRILIIAAIESTSLSPVLEKAASRNIAIIAYDRLIMETSYVDYYVSFDNYLVGVIQAQYIVNSLDLDNRSGTFNIELTAGDPADNGAGFYYSGAFDVLKPYIDSGKLIVVSGQTEFDSVATPEWSTANAQSRAENIIYAFYSDGTNIDAWLCSNDSTALGVINALETTYTGTYPVITGLDCDIVNVKSILTGKQAMSVFKDTRTLASQAVKMATEIANGSLVEINDNSYYNGEITVPAFLCAPVFADSYNYEEILIDSGYYTYDQLH